MLDQLLVLAKFLFWIVGIFVERINGNTKIKTKNDIYTLLLAKLLSIYIDIYLSIYLSIYLFIYLSIYLIQMTQIKRFLLVVNFPDFVTRFKDVFGSITCPSLIRLFISLDRLIIQLSLCILIFRLVVVRLVLLQHRSNKHITALLEQRQLCK